MRRVTSYVLIVLGLFLVFLSPLLRLYAYPRVHKAPLDNYSKIVSRGTGLYYSAKELAVVGPTQLENVKVARGNATAGSSDTAVYDYTSTTRDLGSGGGVINSDRERFVFDRLSAEAVHCCGETPRHEGLTLKFPFDTQKQTYQFWDTAQDTKPQLGTPYPMVYSGTDTVDGLPVYVFKQHSGPSILGSIEVSGKVAGIPDQPRVFAFFEYEADTTVWVEPTTGALVKGTQHATRTLVGPTGDLIFVAAATDLTYTPATVQEQVNTAKKGKDQLRLVSFVLPVFGPIIGVVLIIIGLVIVAGAGPSRRSKAGSGASPTPAPEPASAPAGTG